MKIEKGKIEQGDSVYAALSMAGKTVVEMPHITEAAGVDDVVQALRKAANPHLGMANVCIRNRTRGWMLQMPVLLCKSIFSTRTKEAMAADGWCDGAGQLRLRFS